MWWTVRSPFWVAQIHRPNKEKIIVTGRIVTDADRAPPSGVGEPQTARVGPADQYLENVLDIMLRLGYSELEISAALETVVYNRKQHGL